ncbi:DUF1453 domain-containing protein [Streptomyces sp. CC224B]|uniref:DUF1453 domain-containing protein n=1 Tax=Streptomyces sp. CC224B TaxID=3044571 RepID=UPI0024A816BD|nr:DUF1453 domain-containing protein [Streptomyces sp. CC224B]
MPGFANALLIIAAAGLLAIRQTKPQRMRAARRWWPLPVVLAYCGLRGSGRGSHLIDVHHRYASIALLSVELLVGVAMGAAAWAGTSHIRTEPDGSVRSRETKATAVMRGAGIAPRLGLVGIALLIGMHQGTGALLLGLAASLLVGAGSLELRVGALHPAPVLTAAVR